MTDMDEKLELFLISKEKILLDTCMKSPFLISESDVGAKHYALIDSEIERYSEYVVSTEWRVYTPPQFRSILKNKKNEEEKSHQMDLAVVKKWKQTYSHTKECFSKNVPSYAVEYKIDDETPPGKGHQIQDFVNDVRRLPYYCNNLQRAFALYYYRGKSSFHGNAFDKDSTKYLFRNEKPFSHIEKLNVYFVDRIGIYKLDLC
jgi:hypothetical protein